MEGRYSFFAIACLMSIPFMTGCDAPGGSAGLTASTSPSATGPAATIQGGRFSSCVSSDPDALCIGLKAVSYADSSGRAVADEAQFEKLVQAVNDIWKQCNVAFQIEDYQSVDPKTSGVPAGSETATDAIRQAFSGANQFLVVLTDAWTTNKAGWAQMPGSGPYGAIMDGPYVLSGRSGEITISHELGHYQGLDHVTGSTSLMYPQAVTTATQLSSAECATARSTDRSFWPAMLRK